MNKNYYGYLCTLMYEALHKDAPEDELSFYLSYANKNQKILEPLCGSGRFMVPFLNNGFDISGIDLSKEMLSKLKEKAPKATIFNCDILKFESSTKYDYIFITSGSVSLFTDLNLLREILFKIKTLLSNDGIFVFAVDTISNRCNDDKEYLESIRVKIKDGQEIVLNTKNYFDESTSTQYSPGIYQLYKNDVLLEEEKMEFETHLYKFNEMEKLLNEAGFKNIKCYSSFDKNTAINDNCEMFLYECMK